MSSNVNIKNSNDSNRESNEENCINNFRIYFKMWISKCEPYNKFQPKFLHSKDSKKIKIKTISLSTALRFN